MAVLNQRRATAMDLDANDRTPAIQSTCGHWLRVGNLVAQKCFEQAFEGTGLTSIQYGALQTIDSQPGLGHQQLATRLRTSPSVITTALKPLFTRRLISRQQADQDGRALVYALTPAGKRLLQDCRRRLSAAEEALQQQLDNDEQAELIRLLMKLAGATCS